MTAKRKTNSGPSEWPSQPAPFVPAKEFNGVAREHFDSFLNSLVDAWANGVKMEGLSEDYDPVVRKLGVLEYMSQLSTLSLVAPGSQMASFLPEKEGRHLFVDQAVEFFESGGELDGDAFLFFGLHRELFPETEMVKIRRAFWNHTMDHFAEVNGREESSPAYRLSRLVVSALLMPHQDKDTVSAVNKHWAKFLLALDEAMDSETLERNRRLVQPDPVELAESGFHENVVQLRVIDDCPAPRSTSLNQDSQALFHAASLAEGMTLLSGLANERRRAALKNLPAFRKLLAHLGCIVRKGLAGQSISPENFVKAAKSLTLLTADPVYIMPNGKVVLGGQTSGEDA